MRNYKKEAEWAKQKYDRIEIKLEKDFIKLFKEKLKEDKITATDWVRKNIKNYIKI